MYFLKIIQINFHVFLEGSYEMNISHYILSDNFKTVYKKK